MRREVLICFGLAAITLAVFWPLAGHDFINFDDTDYVTQNPAVLGGLNATSVRWAFEGSHENNWHPLTWLSHMLDCQLFGLRPAGHHLMSLGLHIGSTILLFLALNLMTQALWRSAIVAALFAWHPLHVESVAWVAERKDVLSAFFFMLTLWTYARYVQCGVRSAECGMTRAATQPATRNTLDVPHSTLPRLLFYVLSLAFFALGLMSKSMLVTLPFVLLMLDYWPLRRLAVQSKGDSAADTQHATRNTLPMLLEKLPFLALALAAGLATLYAQYAGGSVARLEHVSVGLRLSNAFASYGIYLGKTIWPTGLSVFYPYWDIGLWKLGGFILLLVAVTAGCAWQRRTRPYLLVGWCWFTVMLLPVIGIVQVGSQSMADRYTYLPLIGLFIALVWGISEIILLLRIGAYAVAVTSVVMLAVCAGATRLQLAHWKNSTTLFTRALEVTPTSAVAHHALGAVLEAEGKSAEATGHYLAALELVPAYDAVHVNLANILASEGKTKEAREHLEGVLGRNPRHARARRYLGNVLFAEGSFAEGAVEYERAWQMEPVPELVTEALTMLPPSAVLPPAAMPQLQKVLALLPSAEALEQLAGAWTGQGRSRLAVQTHRAALALSPESPAIMNNLAWLLATSPEAQVRDGAEAVRLSEQACAATHFEQPLMVGTLAAAYAEANRFTEAVATAEKACALATAARDETLRARNQQLLEEYRAGRAHREPSAGAAPSSLSTTDRAQ